MCVCVFPCLPVSASLSFVVLKKLPTCSFQLWEALDRAVGAARQAANSQPGQQSEKHIQHTRVIKNKSLHSCFFLNLSSADAISGKFKFGVTANRVWV